MSWCESVWVHLIWDSVRLRFTSILSRCEFRRNRYLLWPWRAVYVWQAASLCGLCCFNVFLFFGMQFVLVWMFAVWFLSVCWLLSSPQHPARGCPADARLRLWVCSWHPPSVRLSASLALHTPVAALCSEAPKLPLCPCWSPHQGGDLPACGNLSSFTAPSHKCRSYLDPFVFLCVCAIQLLRISLPLWESEVFCKLSVDVLWELFCM